MAASLSIIVPTHDGEGLGDLFASLEGQMRDGDELLLVLDTHGGRPDVGALPAYVRTLEYDAHHHCWGHCQINAGMQHATGDYLVFIDDDDCFPDGALDAIRRAIAEQRDARPLMFQFWSRRHGRTLPPRHEVRESAIGGHCIVPPNIGARLGRWSCRYAGDYDFIVSTLALWNDGPAWYDEVIACA
jgi:glycosyltransferase involved in cell wall biosynthesis